MVLKVLYTRWLSFHCIVRFDRHVGDKDNLCPCIIKTYCPNIKLVIITITKKHKWWLGCNASYPKNILSKVRSKFYLDHQLLNKK
jgi:hypothetical protein